METEEKAKPEKKEKLYSISSVCAIYGFKKHLTYMLKKNYSGEQKTIVEWEKFLVKKGLL